MFNVGQRTRANTSGNALDVAVVNGVAFVAVDTRGLQMFDATGDSPTLLGTYDTPGHARRVAVSPSGGVAYVADDEGGLLVVDVSDPSVPTLLGSYPLEAARSVQVDGDIVYMADGSVGARIFDVSDPTSPVLLHTLVTDGDAMDVCVEGSVVYVADYGLRVFSLPETPVPTVETPVPTAVPTMTPTQGPPVPTPVPSEPTVEPTPEPLTTQEPTPTPHTEEGAPAYVWVLASVGVAVAVAAVAGAVYFVMVRGRSIYFEDLWRWRALRRATSCGR